MIRGIFRTDNSLKKIEKSITDLFRLTPDAALLINSAGLVETINEKCHKLLGYEANEVRGVLAETLFPDLFSTPALGQRTDYLESREEHDMGSGLDVRGKRKDGSFVWVELAATPLDIDNQEYILLFARDISVRKEVLQIAREKEAEAKSLVEHAPDSIVLIELPGERIAEANQAAADLFGYSRDELIGKPINQLRPEYQPGGILSADFAEKNFKAALAGEQPVYEWTGLNSRGEEVRCENRTLLLPGQERTLLRVSSIDISDRIEKQAAIKAAYELGIQKEVAEKLSRDKSEFLARMGHEIRTPMNGVVGLLELLAYSPLDHDQQEMLLAIQGSAEMMLQILNDLLDFSKIEAGKLEFEKISFDIREVAEHVGEVLGVLASEKGLDLQVNIDPQVPTELTGDPLRLRQILFNLLGNAVKFTQHGSVMLNITMVKGKDPNSISYEIIDTGIGIGAQDLAGIFVPFSQASASTTRRFGGTGLGLTIVKNLVEKMGGQIEVKSVFGKGSIFSFVIDYDDFSFASSQDKRQQLSSRVAAVVPGIEEARSQNRLILLAEDNSTNQMVIGRQLSLLGFAHELADNGAIALSMLREGQYGLLLTDISMPEMDGYELVRSVRQDEKERGDGRALPIVVISAVTRSGQAAESLHAQINDYLTKPMKMQTLQETLNRWLPALPDEGDTGQNQGMEHSSPKSSASPQFRPEAISEFLACDEPQDFNEILLDFQQSASDCIAMMDNDFAASDLKKVADGGHKLKSSARTVGADGMADICQMIEKMAASGNLTELGMRVAALKQEFSDLQYHLKNDLGVK